MDQQERPPNASFSKAALTWLGIMVAASATFLLLILLGDRPFGIQIVSTVAETEFVVLLVFFDTRSSRGYSLRNKTVQQQLPHLFRIHSLVLGLIFIVLTLALSSIPHLPDSWFAESVVWQHNFVRHQSSPFAFVLVMAGSAAAVTEAWLMRRILSRALESASVSPGFSALPQRLLEPNRGASNERLWQILAVSMVCAGLLLLLLGYTALENRYYLTSPQQPNPETGRVYPFSLSGGIVFYQTLAEKWQLDALRYASGFLIFGGMALALWKAPRNRHRMADHRNAR
jgi:hypothetical protein